jgi:uncharacterized protein YjbI with pentapeptide repeats
MIDPITIGLKINQARRQGNLSQTEFAQRLGVSPQAVSKWERGESLPDLIMLDQICQMCNLKSAYFFNDYVPTPNTYASDDDYVYEIDPQTNRYQDSDDEKEILRQKQQDEALEAQVVDNPQNKANNKAMFDLSMNTWRNIDFSNSSMKTKTIKMATLSNCNLNDNNMRSSLIKFTTIDSCTFINTNLSNTIIKFSNFRASNFENTNLATSIIEFSNFSSSHFFGSNFDSIRFSESTFKDNKFDHANFVNVEMRHCIFKDVIFASDIESSFFNQSVFKDCVFQDITITNTMFKGKFSKGVRFVNCRVDKSTYTHLVSSKADVNGITII